MTSATKISPHDELKFGRVLGSIHLAAEVLKSAADLAASFYLTAAAEQFCGDPVESAPLPGWLPSIDSWFPFEQLRQFKLALKEESRREELVMTAGCDIHTDRIHGPVLLLVLYNDGLVFSQGRERHKTQPGQWYVFDDRIGHGVREKKNSTAYLGWAITLQETHDDAYSDQPLMGWTRWHREARDDAASRLGVTRVPIDTWKTAYAFGDTPQQAASRVYQHQLSYGNKHLR